MTIHRLGWLARNSAAGSGRRQRGRRPNTPTRARRSRWSRSPVQPPARPAGHQRCPPARYRASQRTRHPVQAAPRPVPDPSRLVRQHLLAPRRTSPAAPPTRPTQPPHPLSDPRPSVPTVSEFTGLWTAQVARGLPRGCPVRHNCERESQVDESTPSVRSIAGRRFRSSASCSRCSARPSEGRIHECTYLPGQRLSRSRSPS
jgi:hypothetical protein